ncbi:DUF4317 domain-containing protein [Pseudoflavonifractor sp. 524-17]|uniref:DUF4317 domain-containing protein n=1 Tax=Pseudoflavonifractor sp. 524-17 TaxID=2304577 RepID=UPI00137B4AEA|nr:DUF4317 domain-containing protein [Pseudoflavonifractor sp. 524-17]NCE63391.1 DUF4317 domain-containing protein [Pseudoflavonifractor sp. 524-17]
MNEKEISELRRRFKPDKSGITHIRGCCVNEKQEIVSQFDQSLGMMSQEEGEMILATLRRTLSGGLGKNLTDIEFSTQQVADSPEHRLLSALRDSALQDEEAVQAFFQTAVRTLDLEGNYLILLVRDVYDVPRRSASALDGDDAGDQVYTYLLCSVCPVKLTRPALSFRAHENQFGHLKVDWMVSPPELGFLFPAFNSRAADLYGALFYSRDTAQSHREFVDAVFHVPAPMPPAEQKETFQSILADSLGEECSLQVVQSVQDQLCGLIQVHKELKEEAPLVISKDTVRQVLDACGVSGDRADGFEARYDAEFGQDASLSPKNLVDTKQTELRTPDVVIHVNSERGELVTTRIIDGAKYILIRADEAVQVNGVDIHITPGSDS